MRNKHPGYCVHCNNHVPVNKGHFQRASKAGNIDIGVSGYRGKWIVRCLECVDRIRGEKQQLNSQASEPGGETK